MSDDSDSDSGSYEPGGRLEQFKNSIPIKVAPPHCPSCNKRGTLKCARCRGVHYCSTECQAADFPAHKKLCKKLVTHVHRPDADARRAIFFPPDRKEPELIWLDKDPMSEVQALMPGSSPHSRQVFANPLTQVQTESTIHVFFAGNHLFKYEFDNMAIEHAASDRLGFCFRGPVIAVMGSNMGEMEVRNIIDMDLTAYSDLVAWFMNYHNDTPDHEFRLGRTVKGVRMNCLGEQRVNGAAALEVVKLPRTHPVFERRISDKLAMSPMSKLIGMPLLMYQTSSKRRPDYTQTGDPMNQGATYMQVCMDPDSDMFSWAPQKYQTNVQNVIIARADGGLITTEKVQAFSDFCHWHMGAYFQLMIERGEDRLDATKAMAMAEATPQKWATYLSDWRQLKAGVVDDAAVNGRVDGTVRMGLTKKDSNKLIVHLLSTFL